jgi:hypothetical protein
MRTANGNIEMQDFGGSRSLAPMKTMPIFMVMLAAMIIGIPSGILIADRDAFPFLKENIVSRLADVSSYLLVNAKTASAKPETPQVIPIRNSSNVGIYYSSKLDSAQMTFDLESSDLVRTGMLRSLDRIYFDLQDRSREQGTLRRLKTHEAVRIAGDLLTEVRISQNKPGSMRIVLDLKRSCDFTYQYLPGPLSRLMVEILPRRTHASASK